jgi:hypothetical protein
VNRRHVRRQGVEGRLPILREQLAVPVLGRTGFSTYPPRGWLLAIFDGKCPRCSGRRSSASLLCSKPILAERGHHGRVRLRRRAVENSDHRHPRLLRARRPRPDGHTTAHQRDELASPHGLPPQAGSLPYHIPGRVVHHSKISHPMAEKGQSLHIHGVRAMSPLPPIATESLHRGNRGR